MPTYQDELLKKAGAMVRQTQAEGNKPFAGSTYDASASRVTPYAPTATLPTAPTPNVAPVLQTAPAIEENPAEKAYREFQAREAEKAYATSQSAKSDEQIQNDILAQFQGEINAQNAIYANKLARAQQEGQGRLGTTGAIQARRGLLGSDFAVAQTTGVEGANEQIYGTIEAEKQAVIQSILNKGKEMGQKAILEKKAAKEAGLKGYTEYLKGNVERGNKRASDIASLLTAPIESYDPASVEAIANNAGVSVDQIKKAYNEQKKVRDAEAKKLEDEKLESVKTQAEIDKINEDIAKGKRDAGKPIEVGGYIYKPDGQGNWMNSGVKASTPAKEGLTPYQKFSATQSIAKDTQARTENAREMARQATLIDNSYNNIVSGRDRSLNTQAIVTSFNKILDPTSVVRESEYDRTAAGQSLIAKLEGKVQNILIGGAGITDETLKEASDIAKQYIAGAKASIDQQNKRAAEMARQFGLNPDFVSSTGVQGVAETNTSGAVEDAKSKYGITY